MRNLLLILFFAAGLGGCFSPHPSRFRAAFDQPDRFLGQMVTLCGGVVHGYISDSPHGPIDHAVLRVSGMPEEFYRDVGPMCLTGRIERTAGVCSEDENRAASCATYAIVMHPEASNPSVWMRTGEGWVRRPEPSTAAPQE